MKLLTNLEFFVVEAFRGIKRSGLMSIVAIGIVTVTLTLFGLFLLMVVNLGNLASDVGGRMDIVAYVEDALTSDSAAELQVRISRIPGVEKVDFISKEDAWKNFKEDFTVKLDLSDVIGGNPLPDTYAIQVRTPDILPKVAEAVARFAEVDEVRYSGKLIDQIQHLIDAVRMGGAVLVMLFFFATLLIEVNTIRLTVLARETDIYIMRLVGATKSFIRWPFVIEGVIIGVLGGLFGTMIVKSSYEAVVLRIQAAVPFLPVVTASNTLTFIYVIVGFTGTFLGLLGGYISVSRILKERI